MFTNVFTRVLIILTLITGTSCARDHNRYIPVFTDQPRVSTLGFSVKPPPGNDWYEKINAGSLYYLKHLQTDEQAIYTKATEIRFNRNFSTSEALLNYVKKQKEKSVRSAPYEDSHYYYEKVETANLCIRYRQFYGDRKNRSQEQRQPFSPATVSGSGLICIHPDNPSIGIDLYYAESSLPGAEFVTYAAEGEEFLNSLSFLPHQKTL